VWSYPQSTPAGIAATRSIGGRWYDLFVAHQVVFPLVPGTVRVPPATLKYSTPVALQFFSQEERYALTSRAVKLQVNALPAEGRPVGFAGAVASGLRLERRITPQAARIGEGVTVELSISGEGNTALWPAPELRWPAALRAYSDRVEERVSTTDGQVGGTKLFRYLVVPDSAGALPLPAVAYPYYDLAGGRYETVAVPAGSIPVAPAAAAAGSTALPPALLSGSSASLSWRLAGGVPDWIWVLILILPPALLTLRSRMPRLGRRKPPAPRGNLRTAEQELDAVVSALVPDPDRRSGAGLAAAVRATGADAELATRVAAARERLLARRYGPAASPAEDATLTGEVEELVRRLAGSLRGWAGRGTALLLLVFLPVHPSAAQAPSPEALYQEGSLAPAAEGFARRAAAEPQVAAHWYNLGATYYRQGLAGRAAAAWTHARRLAPRSGPVLRALQLTPPPDAISARWVWAPPVTPEELLLAGALGWVAGWLGWALRPRARDRWIVLLVFGAISVAGGLGLRAWYRRPLALVLERTTIRLSPHGLAPIVGAAEPGSALRVGGHAAGWLFVRTPDAQQGWVSDEAVASLGG
jgi:cytochrome c-type biogenesis protein CcmH/NrfG